ncbi:hypothetical protein [uncultured Roseibium sp.]|uniref:hypothetical protein n=1 Tax=uncultured Roseibium sp. TaxID=1936171 RepID=UPI0026320442|nr:hypothetical protein [uncultured Roseibium sp.]
MAKCLSQSPAKNRQHMFITFLKSTTLATCLIAALAVVCPAQARQNVDVTSTDTAPVKNPRQLMLAWPSRTSADAPLRVAQSTELERQKELLELQRQWIQRERRRLEQQRANQRAREQSLQQRELQQRQGRAAQNRQNYQRQQYRSQQYRRVRNRPQQYRRQQFQNQGFVRQ